MKKITALIFFIIGINLFAENYFDNKIVIKIHNNTPELTQLINYGKIPHLDEFFGSYSFKYFINEKLLKQIDKKYAMRNIIDQQNFIANPLRRIFIIEYSQNFDPKTISQKLNKYDFIEYAEPLFKHHITAFPNDLDYDKLYHIPQVHADSAWTITDSLDKVIIGIVDTGVDYLHMDLSKNIYINQGEYGIDEFGNDKSNNQIDDDDNGFIDDWRGWDFVADDENSNEYTEDNDPAPGNKHGTHVAGIAAAVINNITGIAGVANNAMILPVKIGSDNPSSRSTINSYDGLLYAALAGADVINCSWGSSSESEAEADVIAEALTYGPVIVAAAGNDGLDTKFFPATYDGVLSVAAVDEEDEKPFWSNYNFTVDVSAPGVNIFSTVPNSVYERMSGTSMASPVVAGVAALVIPHFKNDDYNTIIERIKATTDDISEINPYYRTKLGTGRVNAYKAITESNPKNVLVKEIKCNEINPDNEYSLSETVNLQISAENLLSDIDDLNIIVYNSYGSTKVFLTEYHKGAFPSKSEILTDPFNITLPDEAPFNYKYEILIEFYDGDEFINFGGTSIFINPSYKTFDANNITTTASSQGNIGFNDYSENEQGVGFRYKNSDNLTYEGSLMIARDTFVVSNVARGSYQSANNMDFDIISPMTKNTGADYQSGKAEMEDNFLDTNNVGVKVVKSVFQTSDEKLKDVIFFTYNVINSHNIFKDSIFVGLYFDWDIGPDVHTNLIYFDRDFNMGICKDTQNDTVPLVGAKLLSDLPLNFFAMDNDGYGTDNPGVYDGFTKQEKWQTLSSGIGRDSSNITDASMVISAGPLSMGAHDTLRISFALFASDNLDGLHQTGDLIDGYVNEYLDVNGNYTSNPKNDKIELIYPNPLYGKDLTIMYHLSEESDVSMDIYDLAGKKVKNIMNNKFHFKGKYLINTELTSMAPGSYYIICNTGRNIINKKFIILE